MNQFEEHLIRYMQEGMEYLRANVPEIQRVESLDDLKDLKLTKHTDLSEILVLQYEATALTLFPAVRQRLIDKGVAKRHNMLCTSVLNEGTASELYRVTIGFYGARLQVSLDIHK